MTTVELVTDELVEKALIRVEQGETTVDDANLLRNYISGLRLMLSVLTLQSDNEAIGDDE
jgi:hypothetical protein